MSAIFVDNFCDLETDQVSKLGFNLVSFSALDAETLSKDFKSAFKPFLMDEEDILYFSSRLSLVKMGYTKAIESLQGVFTTRTFRVVDLDKLGVLAGLVVYETGLKYKRGSTDSDLVKFVQSFGKEVHGLLTTQNMEFLTTCNNVEKINKNATSSLIFPVVYLTGKKREILEKTQGKKRALTLMTALNKEYSINIADYPMIIGYYKDKANAEYLHNSLVKEYGEDSMVLLQKISDYTASVVGENAIVLAFYSKSRG